MVEVTQGGSAGWTASAHASLQCTGTVCRNASAGEKARDGASASVLPPGIYLRRVALRPQCDSHPPNPASKHRRHANAAPRLPLISHFCTCACIEQAVERTPSRRRPDLPPLINPVDSPPLAKVRWTSQSRSPAAFGTHPPVPDRAHAFPVSVSRVTTLSRRRRLHAFVLARHTHPTMSPE